MAGQLVGPVAAGVMAALILTCAIATLVSVITADLPPTKGDACFRKCVEGETRICKFNFNIQPYQTLSRACHACPSNKTNCELPDCLVGDGTKKFINVVNKKLPGPSIQVCKGDKVIVEVHNQLPSEGISLHWHGLTMAKSELGEATPFYDGTPGITQCEIPSKGKFTYTFNADIAGTHWWHSHSGFQRGDGLFGPFIIREPQSKDLSGDTYDYDLPEHTILFNDWIHLPTVEKFALRHFGGDDDFPDSMIVNGHGPYQGEEAPSNVAALPHSRFNIIKGKRYRFRLISAAVLNCPISVKIEGHQMTIIASDGHAVNPFNVSSLVMHPGERFDVVIKSDEYAGLYWISFMGLVDCVESAAHQFAILKVLGKTEQISHELDNHNSHISDQLPFNKPTYSHTKPSGKQLNTPNSGCYDDRVCLADLRGVQPMPDNVKTLKADHTFYLAFTMRKVHNKHFYDKNYYNIHDLHEERQVPSPQVNNISSVNPFAPLLMGSSQPENTCHANAMPDGLSCHNDYCECLHLLKIPYGDTVDIVLIDEGPHSDEGHPVHLHGMRFWVLGQDRPRDVEDSRITREEVMEMDKKGLLKRNLDHPPYKDTVAVPDAGYTVIRFLADNPGYWLLHCHLIFHSMAGMSVVIQVGEHYDMPSPPSNFPTCHHFV